MKTIADYMFHKHLSPPNRDLKHMGICGPNKHSVFINLDEWVINDILFNKLQNENN